MARQPRRLARGTNAQVMAYTGLSGEPIWNQDTGRLHMQDAVTPGGKALALVSDIPGVTLSRGAIAGLVLANNATTPNSKVDISTGQARDSSDTYDLKLAVGLTVDLLASGANGLDSGTKTSNASYHLYLIRRTTDGLLAGLASASATNPTMPSGYSARRRLGAVLTDGSGNIRVFKQTGGYFELASAVNDVASGANGPGAQLRTLSVPAGIKVRAKLLMLTTGDTTAYIFARDPDLGVPNTADSAQADHFRHVGSQTLSGASVEVFTNASRQIYTGDSAANPFLNLYTRGWWDPRDEYA